MTNLNVSGAIDGKLTEFMLSQDESMYVTAIPIEEEGGFGTARPLGVYGDIKDVGVQQQILIDMGLLG